MGRRAKSEFEVHKATVPNGNLKWYIVGRPNKVRQRAWFATKEKAEAEATERNGKMKKLGEDSATVDNALIAMALEGATALAPHGKTLRDAVSFYLSHLPEWHHLLGRVVVEMDLKEFVVPWVRPANGLPIRISVE